MKRKLGLAIGVMSLVMLCGCTGGKDFFDELLEKNIENAPEIATDEDYETYQKLQQEGLLNETGIYNALEQQDYQELQEMLAKQVRVTIATNTFLNIQYYRDAAMTQTIENGIVYLNPGESIFCSQPEPVHAYSNMYVFDSFAIYAYNENGTRGESLDIAGENNVLLTIPEDYTGTEIGILPLGRFEKRTLHFKATYRDEKGVEHIASGTWSVNDVECVGNTMEIGATESYTVKYTYDAGTYYYMDASPQPFASQKVGEVIFPTASATDATESYSVKLRHFVHAVVACSSSTKKNLAITVNGADRDDLLEFDTLRVGDVITLTVKGDQKLYINGVESNDVEKVKGGLRYTVTIPDSDETEYMLSLTSQLYRVKLNTEDDYGTVTYTINGKEVAKTTDYVDVMAEDELVMSYVVTDADYVVEHHSGGLFGGIIDWGLNTFSKKKAEVTITLNDKINGTTICREDYITMKKGE